MFFIEVNIYGLQYQVRSLDGYVVKNCKLIQRHSFAGFKPFNKFMAKEAFGYKNPTKRRNYRMNNQCYYNAPDTAENKQRHKDTRNQNQ